MRTILRRVVFAVVLFTVLLGAALLSLRTYGEQRFENLKTEFAASVAPLPEIELSQTQWQERASRTSDESLLAMRRGSALADDARAALEDEDSQTAISRLALLAELRDERLARHDLTDQIVGAALGRTAIDVADAILARNATVAPQLAAYFAESSLDGWRRTLSYETALFLRWSEVADLHGIDRLYFSLNRPYEAAGALSLYLAMHEALVQDVDDVEAYIRQRVDASRPPFWVPPIAAMLVPNLIDLVEKRQAYLDDLDQLRARLAPSSAAAATTESNAATI